MPSPNYPNQPPQPDQARVDEQKPKNDTGDLALLAEFYAEKFRRGIQTATDPRTKIDRQKQADEMTGAQRRIAGLTKDGYKNPRETIKALDELEQSWLEEKMKPSLTREIEEEEIDKTLAEIRRARAFIEQNQNKDFYADKEFSDWLQARNARLRETRQAEDRRSEHAAAAKTAQQIDALRERLGVKKPEVKALTFKEIIARLSDPNIKTAEDMRRAITPEIKAGILAHILKEIDARIEQGKRLAGKDTDVAVEARNMSTVLGRGAVGREYQFMASASEGEIVSGKKIGLMRVDEFLKKYLDYDLRNDQSRKADLERYTNMID